MASIPMVDTVTGPSMSELWKTRRDKSRYQWSSFGLLTPMFALLVLLFLVPMGFAVYLGLTNLTLVGPTAVKEMVYLAKLIDAPRAQALGFLNEVPASEDGLRLN